MTPTRRGFFGLLAAPFVAALAPFLPKSIEEQLAAETPDNTTLLKWSERPENRPGESWTTNNFNGFHVTNETCSNVPFTTMGSPKWESGSITLEGA